MNIDHSAIRQIVSRRKKLLIATTVPETIATILRGQPRWLNNYYDVSIVCSPGPFCRQIHDAEGIRPLEVSMNRHISPLRDIFSILSAYRIVRRLRPDIVHSYTPKAGLVVMIAASLARVPIRIHTFTGLIFPTRRGLMRRVLTFADRLICSCATHIVAEGLGVARDLMAADITTVTPEVLANGNIAGVDLDYYDIDAPGVRAAADELRVKHGIHDGVPILGYIGRLNPDKGLSELAEAVFRINNSSNAVFDRPLKLLCVGDYDASAPLKPEIKVRLEQDPNILLVGWHRDIRPFLAIIDALVLPSYREGFPNVLLQGSSMQVPLIATDINGSNEIVVHGVTGLLVPVRCVRSLEDAIVHLLNYSDATRAAIGKNGRARIIEFFTQSTVRTALLNFYAKVSRERAEQEHEGS